MITGESAKQLSKDLTKKSVSYWERVRQKNALALFHKAAVRVPAYKDFLRKNGIDHRKIISFEDFQRVPSINKSDYLRQYPLEKLVWDGKLKNTLVWTSTSGSTGKPFYFPRTGDLDAQYSVLIESFLKDGSRGANTPTLVIIGFGMGVWIGGLITYKAFEIAGNRLGNPLSILTPGINKEEIFHALESLSPHFDQTILVGYPPFIKDIIEEAPARRIDLKKKNIRLLFAAEAFTESFRDILAERAGIKNVYRDTLNIYGTADLGAMAFETPLSIFLRRKAIADQGIFKALFSNIEKTPTLAQYNPKFISFEAEGNQVLLTGNNTIPLVRYKIGDNGGVFSAGEAEEKMKARNIDLKKEIKRAQLPFSHLPFVYIYERSDFSVKLYGAIVYPEHIKEGLAHASLSGIATGRFTMMTKLNKKNDQYLEINVELKPRIKPTERLKRQVQQRIVSALLDKNAEYRNNHNSMPQKVIPSIVFWNYEDPLYFKTGIKQKWVIKNN